LSQIKLTYVGHHATLDECIPPPHSPTPCPIIKRQRGAGLGDTAPMRLRYSPDEAVNKKVLKKGKWPLFERAEFPDCMPALARLVKWIWYGFLARGTGFSRGPLYTKWKTERYRAGQVQAKGNLKTTISR